VHNVRQNSGPIYTPLFHDSSPPYSGLTTAGFTVSLVHLKCPGYNSPSSAITVRASRPEDLKTHGAFRFDNSIKEDANI
jgi:hypothetical protein